MSEVDTYKIFRELEARGKRANPYKFYDKDELIDEILKDEDEIERLNNIIKEVREYILQHCEIIRFENENIDKVGKVEGIPLLEILDKENKK